MTSDPRYSMTPQQRKIAITQSVIWTIIVVIAMVMGCLVTLTFTGLISWLTPQAALFGTLATFALVGTQFSLMLGGGERKHKKPVEGGPTEK